MTDDLFGKTDAVAGALFRPPGRRKFVDLFCGIGGFHLAAANLGMECVFASDLDDDARDVYADNFHLRPAGDITEIAERDIPNHDFLFAGFPCQPFSIIGDRKGFNDERNGRLFFEILRIADHHRPPALILENVKQLATANKGGTIALIQEQLKILEYKVDWRILNALDFGLPQKRERVLIIATQKDLGDIEWPTGGLPMRPLSDILEPNPPQECYASERIRKARQAAHQTTTKPAIWFENKSGNISSHPYSCALRAGASYNYLLVDGKRRLTTREQARLQGYPDSFRLHAADARARTQMGNSVPVPMVQEVIAALLKAYDRAGMASRSKTTDSNVA